MRVRTPMKTQRLGRLLALPGVLVLLIAGGVALASHGGRNIYCGGGLCYGSDGHDYCWVDSRDTVSSCDRQ
jgi:hypothetical protein